MLRSLRQLSKYLVETRDGMRKEVKDFYFDDWVWIIRYAVVDTGNWLPGKQALLSPAVFDPPRHHEWILPVALTGAQIDQSPGIEADRPVSLQKEEELVRYYQWPSYWTSSLIAKAATEGRPQTGTAVQEKGDLHLRNAEDVYGYQIQSKDGEIGRIDDFLVDDETWAIRYAVIDTSRWIPGRKVLIASEWIIDVNWEESKAFMMLTKEQIKASPPYDAGRPPTREDEIRLYQHYDRPKSR